MLFLETILKLKIHHASYFKGIAFSSMDNGFMKWNRSESVRQISYDRYHYISEYRNIVRLLKMQTTLSHSAPWRASSGSILGGKP